MGIFNRKTEKKNNYLPPERKCANLIARYSAFGIQSLEKEIRDNCKSDDTEKEYILKYSLSLFELLSFWAFYLNLVGDQLIGDENTQNLINDATPLFVEIMISNIWREYSAEFIKNKMDEIYPFISERVSSYFECEELFSEKPNPNRMTCMMRHMHRLGAVQRLCDYLFMLIHNSPDCPVSMDLSFDMLVIEPIMDYIKSDELDKYVIEYRESKAKTPTK